MSPTRCGARNYRFLQPFLDLTKDLPFHLVGGETASVPLMARATSGEIPYFKGNDFQAVELKYKGDGVSMAILLPDKDFPISRTACGVVR